MGDTAPVRPATPDLSAPIRFHPEPPDNSRHSVLTWVVRGLGLVGVAVVSGLVWWYVSDDTPPASGPPPSTEPQVTGEFAFTAHPDVPMPRKETNCAAFAYDDVKKFLADNKCQRLTRALYTTTTKDKRTVYTSVVVVRMPTSDDARQLQKMTDLEGTGNVNDLIKDGVVKVPNLKSLAAGDGYHSVVQDRDVIIVESDFDPVSKSERTKANEELLDRISRDAIRLGEEIKS
jgi:hypothetical protein